MKTMQKTGLLLLFLLLHCSTDHAWAFGGQKLPDSLFVKRYAQYLHVTMGLQTNNVSFTIRDVETKQDLIFSPTVTLQQFIKLEYRGFVLKWSISPKYLNEDESSTKGQNRRISKAYGVGFGRFGVDFLYEKSKGYYLENTAEFDTAWKPGDPYIQYNSLKSVLYGVQFSYNTRRKFSEAAVNSCREKQLRFSYSFIPTLSINHITYSDEQYQLGPNQPSATKFLDVNLKLPLAFALPFARKWQISTITGPIIGVSFVFDQYYDDNLNKQIDKQQLFSSGFYFNLGMSYNSRIWYIGTSFYSETYGARWDDNIFRKNFDGFQLYSGIRFGLPKKVKRYVDWPFDQVDRITAL